MFIHHYTQSYCCRILHPSFSHAFTRIGHLYIATSEGDQSLTILSKQNPIYRHLTIKIILGRHHGNKVKNKTFSLLSMAK